jgi:putative nucleotidyltransferase with HDIG domain
MKTSEETYRAMQNLPQFPSLATKFLRVLSDDDADVREIVNLIRTDAALAAELLRIVNSPLYALPGRISSIQSAVTLLGFEAVKSFALTVSMRGFLQPSLRLDLLRKVWRHSLACAIICEEISKACSPIQRSDDRAYTAGLLHDIGRLGMFVGHPQDYGALLTSRMDSGADLLALEREVFGINHCEAGTWLAKKWGFPEELQEVTAGHHKPVEPEFGLVDLVRVAILLADKLGFEPAQAADGTTAGEVLSLLPQSAQYRIEPDPAVMKARITYRLDSFD